VCRGEALWSLGQIAVYITDSCVNCFFVRKESRLATGLIVLGITAFLTACQNGGTGASKTGTTDPNTAFAEYGARTNTLLDLPGMCRLGKALDFPAELVHMAGVAKAAFSMPWIAGRGKERADRINAWYEFFIAKHFLQMFQEKNIFWYCYAIEGLFCSGCRGGCLRGRDRVNTFVRALDSDRYQLIEKKDNKEVYRDKQTGEKWVVEVHRRKD
jgi:hypothetical protein